MKLRCLPLLLVTTAGFLAAADSPLLKVKNIYILPMSSGLDQYLANRITREGRYTVVTDAKAADALLSDQIGNAFEDRYKELYPPPPPPPEPAAAKDAKDAKPAAEKSIGSIMSESAGNQAARVSSFSRGKGNIFLIDRQSRQVIWSTFLPSRTSRPQDMNRAADQIVDRIGDDIERREKAIKKATVASAPPPPSKTAPAAK